MGRRRNDVEKTSYNLQFYKTKSLYSREKSAKWQMANEKQNEKDDLTESVLNEIK